MKLALIQMRPPGGAPDETLARIAGWLEPLGRLGVDLAVFPELVLPGYNRPAAHGALAQTRDGLWSAQLAAMARAAGCGLAYGWAERDVGAVYNAASVIDASGRRVAHYRKIQLFGAMERASFAAGTEPPPVFELAGRRCGLLVCYDVEFPEHPRDLARRGAELVLVPTANPSGYGHVQDLLVPARACENGICLAYANYCGSDGEIAFGGGSLVAGPDGQALARAGAEEACLIVDLPPPGPGAGHSTQLADLRQPG